MSSKSNVSGTATKRYALALYELAKENAELDTIEMQSKTIYGLLQQSSEFRSLIKDPTIKKNEQLKAIQTIISRYKFTNIFTKFLCFLCLKRRLFFLEKILDNFSKLISRGRGEIEAQLTSSKKLSSNEIEIIQKELSENFASKVKLDCKYDSTLIGGLVIQVGSVMIDTSIKNKLRQLEKRMIET